jgi:hypothetical protein
MTKKISYPTPKEYKYKMMSVDASGRTRYSGVYRTLARAVEIGTHLKDKKGFTSHIWRREYEGKSEVELTLVKTISAGHGRFL